MGLTVYLDSCIVIYLVEEHTVFAPLLERKLLEREGVILAVTRLAELECLVLPYRNNDQRLVDKFRSWFSVVNILALDDEIFPSAARLRAKYPGLKSPDAIHLSAALHHGCTEFWTNDGRLDNIAPSIVKNLVELP